MAPPGSQAAESFTPALQVTAGSSGFLDRYSISRYVASLFGLQRERWGVGVVAGGGVKPLQHTERTRSLD